MNKEKQNYNKNRKITERLENELKEVNKDHKSGLYFTEKQFIKDVINVFDKMAKSNINKNPTL